MNKQTSELALELDYKLFHRKHFYPGMSEREVLEAELDKIIRAFKPKRDKLGRFRTKDWWEL